MKTKRLNLRCGVELFKKIERTEPGSKNRSAFLSKAIEGYIKYRALIEQAEKLKLKTAALKVVEK